MDDYEIGRIPGIGCKISQKIRVHVLGRAAEYDTGLVYGGTKEHVSVRDVLKHPGMSPEVLERLLGGSGSRHGTGTRIWELLNGCDDTEVGQAREVPTQISMEDSYVRLVTLGEVTKELHILATSLLRRMHTDLLEDEGDDEQALENNATTNHIPAKRWLAHPKTIRLSTRPRPAQNPDGSRNRSFARISKSAPMPNFVFNLKESVETLVERLVTETLLPLFRRLHPEKSGWNLSLVNIAAANMADAARDKGGVGRDIAKMFRQQDGVLKQWRVEETDEKVMKDRDERVAEDAERILEDADEKVVKDTNSEVVEETDSRAVEGMEVVYHVQPQQQPPILQTFDSTSGSEDMFTSSQQADVCADHDWNSEDEEMDDADTYLCERCGAMMPWFAMGAHERFHTND
jgi:DNA polymerase iota